MIKHRISILCDNTVGPVSGTLGEHGFAALVESPGGALLFDTGQGATLLANAQRLNKDLHRVETVVLSHGHYDHTGGLLPLLRSCGPKRLLAHPALFAPRYRVKDTGDAIAIGIPYSEEYLLGQGARFDFSREPREVAEGVLLTGEVPRRTDFETGDRGLYGDPVKATVDLLPDDQSLVIRGERGLTILLGCCHAGLVNTIEAARHLTGEDEVYAVVGGTHLGFCAGNQLEQTIQALRRYRVKKICAGHCTGFAAAARLAHEFPGAFQPTAVGYCLEV